MRSEMVIFYSLQDIVCQVFKMVDLDWNDHVNFNKSFYRPSDLQISKVDPSKASKLLNWKAPSDMYDVVKKIVNDRLSTHKKNNH